MTLLLFYSCDCCSKRSSRSSSSKALINLLHLYLLKFFKFFSKLNIIFFSTIQYFSLLHYHTGVILYRTIGSDAYLGDSSRCLVLKHNRSGHVCNRIGLVPSAAPYSSVSRVVNSEMLLQVYTEYFYFIYL